MNNEQSELRRFEMVETDWFLLQPTRLCKVFGIPSLLCQLSLLLLSTFRCFCAHPPIFGETFRYPVVRDLFRRPVGEFPKGCAELPKIAAWRASAAFVNKHAMGLMV